MLKHYSGLRLAFVLIFIFSLPYELQAQKSSRWKRLNLFIPRACKLEDGLKVTEITRWDLSEGSRTVNTYKGQRTVSVADGYTIIFTYSGGGEFANVKVEQSKPEKYTEDKEAVIDGLKHIRFSGGELTFNEGSAHGYESYWVDKPVIDKGETVGIRIIFFDADKTIMTIYFLNQKSKKRRFESIEEYHKLKENFLNQYLGCVKERLENDSKGK